MVPSNDTEPVVALVVAAGSGVRLGSGGPKALQEVHGRSLLARSITQLLAGGCTHVVVVAPPDAREAFEAEAEGASGGAPVVLVEGGQLRQDSVRNGLRVLAEDPDLQNTRVVLVHDAARPFVPADVVTRVIDAVRGGAVAVVPVISLADSIRQLTEDGSFVVDRSLLRAVQTPQGFDFGTLVDAHNLVLENGIDVTDDAAACEFAGHSVALVEGDRLAFKVTDPLDLRLADLVAQGF